MDETRLTCAGISRPKRANGVAPIILRAAEPIPEGGRGALQHLCVQEAVGMAGGAMAIRAMGCLHLNHEARDERQAAHRQA